MKKALFTLMCLFAMVAAGTGLKAQEVTVTLIPGWTWISCPATEAMDFATALGDFTPMQGDVIKSQWGSAIYRNGQWKGTVSQFIPGYGYHYKSTRQMPVILTFNAQQSNPQVVVTTSEPMMITAISAMGGGEVTVSDGTYILVKGLCWAAHENPTTNDDFFEEAESGVGSFSLSMTDLNISTTYYVRAYAVTSNGTVYGVQKAFTTRDGIPTLTTANVSSITGISATCGGNVTDNGGLNVTARGVCWSTSPNPTIANPHTTNGGGLGSFSSSIMGLNVSTTYYVRAYATTAAGTAYGGQKTLTTRDGIPTLTTTEVTNITGATATCGGNITDNGGLNVTARGVCWSTSPNPTIADSHTTNGSGNGSFSSSITGLNVSTTYYVRAYATTAAGTAYGEEKTFTTRDGIPTLTTTDITNITGITAISGGNITDDGGLDITARGVCWATHENPTINEDAFLEEGSGVGSFTATLTGLNISTTYYVRAYAVTPCGTVYGEQQTFTTRDGIPTLTTTDITNINTISATSGGNITDNGGLNVTARGVCWSTSPNPTVSDSHTTNGTGTGTFTSSITGLEVSTIYYVRAYATTNAGAAYGNEVSFTTLDFPVGAIDALFSVSVSQQVYFSQGNLQYQASTNTWRFADNQYDYIGDANSNISSTYDGWIDLFGWGTSGWDNENTYYHPWDSNTNGRLYGPPGDYDDLTGYYACADWGVYNPISNGGNTANQWRTLTMPEWNYVFNTRSTTSGIRYAKAEVNGVNGIILLPNDWSSSTYSLSNTNSSGASFSSNTLTASQWSTLEQAGAVFLPAAGLRSGTSVYGVGSKGGYWSTSVWAIGDGSGAFKVDFYDSFLSPSSFSDRHSGLSVRLTRVAE